MATHNHETVKKPVETEKEKAAREKSAKRFVLDTAEGMLVNGIPIDEWVKTQKKSDADKQNYDNYILGTPRTA